jgi:DNA-binding protein HU-beta
MATPMMTIRAMRASGGASHVTGESNVSRAQFHSRRVAMASGLSAVVARAGALAGELLTQCKFRRHLDLIHIIACDSQSFPGFSKNESLRLQCFRPTSASITANEPLIRYRERIGPMTKNELIAAVADKAQMTKTAAATAVDATFDAITSTLKKGGEVKIMGFGNFRVVKRAAREGRDPRTGAPVKIKAAKRPRFSAGKGLKDAVNK